MKQKKNSICIGIPTFNRHDWLLKTLAMLHKLEGYDSVFVYDQSGLGEAELKDREDCLRNYGNLTWENSTEWASLPAARNVILEKASADIVVFIDDDVDFDQGYIDACVETFKENESLDILVGPILSPSETHAESEIERVGYTTPTYINASNLTGGGGNMAIRKETVEAKDVWFDERLRGNFIREEDLFFRDMLAKSAKMLYHPDFHLVHYGEPEGGCKSGVMKRNRRSFGFFKYYYHNEIFVALRRIPGLQGVKYAWGSFIKTVPTNEFFCATLCKGLVKGLALVAGAGLAILSLFREKRGLTRKVR